MSVEVILCPVCGKYDIYDFDEFETCPVCGWEVNLPQYADHNLSNGRNALNVNDHKVYYEAMQIPEIRPQVDALRKVFLQERWDIKEQMRDFSCGETKKDFEMCQEAFQISIDKFVAALHELIAGAKK